MLVQTGIRRTGNEHEPTFMTENVHGFKKHGKHIIATRQLQVYFNFSFIKAPLNYKTLKFNNIIFFIQANQQTRKEKVESRKRKASVRNTKKQTNISSNGATTDVQSAIFLIGT